MMQREIDFPDTITFRHGQETRTVKVSELPDATVVALFIYGRRKANDKLNSQAAETAKDGGTWNHARSLDLWVDSAVAGTLGESSGSGGGPRLTTETVVGREVADELIRARGGKPDQKAINASWRGALRRVGYDAERLAKVVEHVQDEAAKRDATRKRLLEL